MGEEGLLLAEPGSCGLESRTVQVEFDIPVRCQGETIGYWVLKSFEEM